MSIPLPRRGRFPAATVLVMMCAASLAGCSLSPPGDAAPAGVSVGLLVNTGGRSVDDIDAVRGARLAADVVNGSHPQVPLTLAPGTGLPGLGGATVSIVVGDTLGTNDGASTAASDLVATAGASGLVIADAAEVTAAAASQTQRLQRPLVDAASTATFVSALGLDWYFRTVPTDRVLAETAFALLRRQVRGVASPRLALLTDAGGQTAATAALVRDLAQRAGYPISVDAADIMDATRATLRARQIDEADCVAILALAGTPGGPEAVTRVAERLSTPLPVIGLGPGFTAMNRPQQQAGRHAPVVLRATSWSAELARRSPVGRAVTSLYQSSFGVPMTTEAANAFTATMAIAHAIDAAGSAEPQAIRGALHQLTISATDMIMPWNGVRFDADGENQLAAGVVEGLDTAGFRLIYPRELASGSMMWAAGDATRS